MREEISMPAECIAPIPEWMSLPEAVLLEPLCIGAYAVERSRAARGSRAAIVGAGPIGLSVLLGLEDLNPSQILVSEPIEARRDAALRLGASAAFDPGGNGAAEAVCGTSEGGVDVVFDCAGTQEAIDDAAHMLKPGGTLVLIGIPEGTDRITYDPHLMRRREIATVNVRRQNRMLERAIRILERRRDAASVILTHRFPPSQAVQAFRMVEHREDRCIKAIIEF
jgi:L-iditol 2-dehydrogenase